MCLRHPALAPPGAPCFPERRRTRAARLLDDGRVATTERREARRRHGRDVLAVDLDGASAAVVEAEQEVQDARLASSRRSDERVRPAPRDRPIAASQDLKKGRRDGGWVGPPKGGRATTYLPLGAPSKKREKTFEWRPSKRALFF